MQTKEEKAQAKAAKLQAKEAALRAKEQEAMQEKIDPKLGEEFKKNRAGWASGLGDSADADGDEGGCESAGAAAGGCESANGGNRGGGNGGYDGGCADGGDQVNGGANGGNRGGGNRGGSGGASGNRGGGNGGHAGDGASGNRPGENRGHAGAPDPHSSERPHASDHPHGADPRAGFFAAPLRWLGLASYASMLRAEFAGYGARAFAADAAAGLITAAVALPLALAFGVSSGASAAAGMVTAIVAGVLIGAFSGAFYQISGPTGAMAAILAGIAAHYGLHGVFAATFLAGAILLLAGVLHLGRAISFIPMPVIIGFTSGIAIIIALGQIDAFLGTASEGSSALARLIYLLRHPQWPHWPTAALGALCLALLLAYPRSAARYVPAPLAVLIIATAAAWALDLPVATVGEIPATLLLAERFSLADLHPEQLGGLLVPAASIAVLGMIESLLCGASAGRMAGVRLRCDQELIAQGLGNLAVPFFGGVPATAAIARTSVAIKSGARTRLAGIIHALVLLAAVYALGPLMSRIPLCALAAVLFVTAWRMNDWAMIRYIFARRFKGAMLKFTTTMLATIIFDLATAILVGVGLALVILITQISHLHTRRDHFAAEKMRGLNTPLPASVQSVEVVYVMGALVFANTEQIEELGASVPDGGAVIFSMRGTSYMDISGAAAFMQMLRRLRGRGVSVIIAGVNNEVKLMMRRAGVVAFVGSENFYWSVEKIVE